MKTLDQLTVSTLRVEEMFNVRGGDGKTTSTTSATSKNSTATGVDEDIIL